MGNNGFILIPGVGHYTNNAHDQWPQWMPDELKDELLRRIGKNFEQLLEIDRQGMAKKGGVPGVILLSATEIMEDHFIALWSAEDDLTDAFAPLAYMVGDAVKTGQYDPKAKQVFVALFIDMFMEQRSPRAPIVPLVVKDPWSGKSPVEADA